MYQPYSSSGQLTGPPRPPAPAPVLTAVKLMYAGAAISLVTVITELALIPAIKAALRTANPSLTAVQVRDVNVLLTLEIVLGLAVVALWLWMARANGHGRNWARILSTVLFGLATLDAATGELPLVRTTLTKPQYGGGYLAHFTLGGHEYWVIHSVFGAVVLGVIVPVLWWLIGLAVVWLLWRPASSAFFKPQGSRRRWDAAV
jgi:hypothetical protein